MRNKIIFSLIAIIILVVSIVYINIPKKDETNINVIVEIIKDDRIEYTDIIITNGSLVDSLNENFEIVIENGMIKKIDFLEAYNTSEYFIKINVNDVFSLKGINNIILEEDDKISFIYTKVV